MRRELHLDDYEPPVLSFKYLWLELVSPEQWMAAGSKWAPTPTSSRTKI